MKNNDTTKQLVEFGGLTESKAAHAAQHVRDWILDTFTNAPDTYCQVTIRVGILEITPFDDGCILVEAPQDRAPHHAIDLAEMAGAMLGAAEYLAHTQREHEESRR